MENKKWYQSKLIWLGVAMTVSGVYKALTGGDDSMDIDKLQQLVEGVTVLVLRLTTTKGLTK
jgi:hypothetical protein